MFVGSFSAKSKRKKCFLDGMGGVAWTNCGGKAERNGKKGKGLGEFRNSERESQHCYQCIFGKGKRVEEGNGGWACNAWPGDGGHPWMTPVDYLLIGQEAEMSRLGLIAR